MSQDLRNKILKFLEEHDRTPKSGEYVNDSTLAGATGETVDDVQRQLDILEAQGHIKTANTFDSKAALIAPSGLLLVEQQGA